MAHLLRAVAAAKVLVHVAEVVLAATVMAPGARDAPLPDRMAWLSDPPLGWTLGWAVWGSSAAVDVVYVAVLGGFVRAESRLPAHAVSLACFVAWTMASTRDLSRAAHSSSAGSPNTR